MPTRPELEVQKLLRSVTADSGAGQALVHLYGTYAVQHTFHGEHLNLVLLKYRQGESPMDLRLVQECRGLILDMDDDWNVVAMPYTKFWNAGDELADQIDWRTAQVWEKLDGSLICLFYYKGKWHVSTSGVPDASCRVGDHGMSFAELFWQAVVSDDGYSCTRWLDALDPCRCYMFELCSAYNRVVVKQDLKPKIYLHGVRNLVTLEEEDPRDHARRIGVDTPSYFYLSSLDRCLEAAKILDPLKQEGFVVCDSKFRRVKIKSPAYIALHYLADLRSSKKKISLLIRDGESEEFEKALTAFPEFKPVFEDLKSRYESYVTNVVKAWDSVAGFPRTKEGQKEFAQEVVFMGPAYSTVLFELRKRGCDVTGHDIRQSVKSILKDMRVSAYMNKVMKIEESEG